MKMQLGMFKEGIYFPIKSDKESLSRVNDHFSLSVDFFSGNISATLNTKNGTYSLEDVAPHIPFRGYSGVIKYYSSELEAWDIQIEERHGPKELEKEFKYKYDVFVCHSSKDKDIIKELVHEFRKNGIRYWIDHEQIKFGDNIATKIDEGLKNSKYILVCLSRFLGRSNWCRVEYGVVLHRELRLDSSRKVIPIKLDDCSDEEIPDLLFDKKRADFQKKEEFYELLHFLIDYRK